MKKMRKIFAVLLTLAMVLAMSIPTFAATATTITVNGLDTNATVTYKQIIAPDITTATGWKFIDDNDAKAFADNNTVSADEQQNIIWKLIKMESGDKKVTNMPAGTTAYSTSDFQTAVGKIPTSTSMGPVSNGTVTLNDVTSAGIYVINADSKKDGKATAYKYAPMAAYVSFGAYDTNSGVPSSLVAAVVKAKSTTVDITKTNNETDKVVEVGKVVTYNATTKMPYVSAKNNIINFKLVDTIEGAKYVTEKDGQYKGKVKVDITVGTATETVYVDVVKNESKKDTITVDLTKYLNNNAYANATVNISYKAEVTSTTVNNSIIPNDGENTFAPATDTLYTGTVTLTKTGEKDKEGNAAKLENAEFVLVRKTVKDNVETLKYAVASQKEGKAEYTVTSWVEEKEKASATAMKTDADGKIVVKGLDDSVGEMTYEFKETKAPNGYSINETNAKVKWDTEGNGTKAESRTGAASMTDTKLSALPSTGGIGTTIFTIAGCLIMVTAAGLFFASRKRTNK